MSFLHNLRRMFVSRKCVICDDPISYDERVPICDDCIEEWDEQLDIKCNTCGNKREMCACIPYELKKISPFVCFSVFYTGSKLLDAPDSIVHHLKDSRSIEVLRFCADLMTKSIISQCKSHGVNYKDFAITYAPRSLRKFREYDVDQSKELAKIIAKNLSIPMVKSLENRSWRVQKKLNKAKRYENAKKAYRLKKKFKNKYDNYFIVDDVLTSGATLYYCSKLLIENGAKRVIPVTYAKDNIKKGDKK